jgi:uncharacterized radical SAM superfamily Fe-S cluster-containing enzyme
LGEKVVRKTLSICTTCREKIPATILLRGNNLFMVKVCPSHGPMEALFWKNYDFYKRVRRIVGDNPDPVEVGERFHDFTGIRGVLVDLTTRCNLSCRDCFTNANLVENWEPSLEEIQERLGCIQGRKPVVFLQGGEPTLRQDLVAIVQTLIQCGYTVKLVTKGIQLVDEGYVRELRKAGLEWVFLQFDGFSDEVSRAFRGRALVEVKQKALENLVRNDFKVLLAMMVERGLNLNELGGVFHLALETPNIQQISFLPASHVGRRASVGGEDFTTPLDVMETLENVTNGQLTRCDFLAFMRLAKIVYRISGNADFKPKSCFFPMMLYRSNGKVIPLNRMANPVAAIRNSGVILELLPMIRHIRRLDNAPPNRHFLFMCIEHFRDPRNIDLLDALHCNKIYMTKDGFAKSCIYNNRMRTVQFGERRRRPVC